MARKILYVETPSGTVKVLRNDDTYDNFSFLDKDDNIIKGKEKIDIYGVMEFSMDAYEYFKADQQGTTVGELYNN